jgi:hypothetical protein
MTKSEVALFGALVSLQSVVTASKTQKRRKREGMFQRRNTIIPILLSPRASRPHK